MEKSIEGSSVSISQKISEWSFNMQMDPLVHKVSVALHVVSMIVLVGIAASTSYASIISISFIQIPFSFVSVFMAFKKVKNSRWKRLATQAIVFSTFVLATATASIAIIASSSFTESQILCHSKCSNLSNLIDKTSQTCFNSNCANDVFSGYQNTLNDHLKAMWTSIFVLFTQIVLLTIETNRVIAIKVNQN
jgi:hypothetical protein